MTKNQTAKPRPRRGNEIRTIDDVRMKLVVNSLKIKAEQNNFMMTVLPGGTPMQSVMMSNIWRMENIMQYVTIAMTTFRMAKNAINFFRSFKKS